jgi:hypothetical protein
MSDKCLVYRCANHKDEGAFEGDLCVPCYRMLTTGVVEHGETFIHDMQARLDSACWENHDD